ncbi:alpha/beta fold hydrolase [Actinomycetospora cinnamomea]|uniref:DNA-binding SARP family transcriptional activator n=1 Tax=Actinomycetospora cinnamomea TaxID=663609 RepID=A0A2U1FHP0_9PSEU|nr:alpha/beta fold hydrolase [Actinomycetospora cinnamomea]PVZ11686.1 DNA-binding SARP family transcriptional activator [Actinomycetospora cinnamomea]
MTSTAPRFRVLGPLEVAGEGGPRPVHGERQRTLLAALLAARGATVSADTLVDHLWGDAPPDKPAGALYSQVSRLRRALGDVLADDAELVTGARGYALAVPPDDVDALRFERLVAAARSATGDEAAALYDEALALWRGPAYDGFADLHPASLEGIRLDELRLAAVEERARMLLALGRAESVIPEMEGFVQAHPLREEARAVLMRALYAHGRHTAALQLYQDYRERLAEELGLEPSAALRRLQGEILSHAVEPPATPRPPTRPVEGATGRVAGTLDTLQVRYLRHAGSRIAHATVGDGSPLVVVPAWVTSLDVIASGRDPRSSLLERLAGGTRLTLYDRLGAGLSRSEEVDFSLAASVAELEAVVEHTGPAALLAVSQSGPAAVSLAARRPDLVTRLILVGTFANAHEVFRDARVNQAIVDLARGHWGMGARLLADLYRPGASTDAGRHLARVLRDSADGEVAAGYLEEMYRTDVSGLLPAVTAPALVMHYRGDRVIPYRGAQQLARGLPDARLVPLEGPFHLPDAADLARIVEAITDFLGPPPASGRTAAPRPGRSSR